MTDDPTIASIEAQNSERDRLRAENARLRTSLAEALVDAENLRAERVQLTKEHYDAGYGRAVHEIRHHFEKVGNVDIAAVIAEIWKKERS